MMNLLDGERKWEGGQGAACAHSGNNRAPRLRVQVLSPKSGRGSHSTQRVLCGPRHVYEPLWASVS